MKSPLLHSARTGLVFAIVHIFLVLIGFNTLVGTLLARVSGAQLVGSLPPARWRRCRRCPSAASVWRC